MTAISVNARAETTDHLDARTDQELIAAINSGNSAAFEALYARYRDWVVALAHRFTQDPDLSLDVLQETFLYVLRKFPGFRLTAQMKTFLYPAVRNLSIAARRKSERTWSTEADLAILENTPAEAAAVPVHELPLALATLPEEQREVLLLRFVDDLTLAEIADAVEIPLGTVKSRLHNALATLRSDPRTKEFFES
jgi:RNA polymerase sigma-70 factor (ECF subfamily)